MKILLDLGRVREGNGIGGLFGIPCDHTSDFGGLVFYKHGPTRENRADRYDDARSGPLAKPKRVMETSPSFSLVCQQDSCPLKLQKPAISCHLLPTIRV